MSSASHRLILTGNWVDRQVSPLYHRYSRVRKCRRTIITAMKIGLLPWAGFTFDLACTWSPNVKTDPKCKDWWRRIEVRPWVMCARLLQLVCASNLFFFLSLSLSLISKSFCCFLAPWNDYFWADALIWTQTTKPVNWELTWGLTVNPLVTLSAASPYLLHIRVPSLYNTYSRFNRHLWQISYLFLTVIPRPFVTSHPWCSPAILRVGWEMGCGEPVSVDLSVLLLGLIRHQLRSWDA